MPKLVAVGSLPPFCAFSPAERHDIAPHLQYGVAAPGTLLICAGANATPLIVVRQGEVSLSHTGRAGRTILLERRRGPCIVGDADVLASQAARIAVRADSVVHYVMLGPTVLNDLLRRRRPCMAALLEQLTAQVARTHAILEARLARQWTMPRPLQARSTRHRRCTPTPWGTRDAASVDLQAPGHHPYGLANLSATFHGHVRWTR